MAFRLGILLLAALLCLSASAQVPTPQPERRTVAVSVLDKDGNAVHGLTAANFRGTYRGQPVKILSATEDSSPRRIALIIDVSGSMMDRDQWTIGWAAAKDLVLSIGPRNQVELFSLGEILKRHGQLAWRDEKELDQALDLAEASARNPRGGGTALCDGIIEAAQQIAGLESAIYLISDGVDTSSSADHADVEAALSGRGVRLYLLRPTGTPVPAVFRSSVRLQAREITSEVVSATGGRIATLQKKNPKPADIPAQARPLYESLTRTYRLELELPAIVKRPSQWKLEVVGLDHKPLEGAEVDYRRLLVPVTKK